MVQRTRQAEFLLANGFEQVYADLRDTADQDWNAASQLRSAVTRLLDPRGMGGFAVVILGRDAPALDG